MKKKLVCILLALTLSLSAAANALCDASFPTTQSYQSGGYLYADPASGLPIYTTAHLHGLVSTNDYYGYSAAEGIGGVSAAAMKSVRVISKSATVWREARTGSSKIGSVGNGETLECVVDANGYSVTPVNGFYPVWYKGQYGYINKNYVVLAPFEIVLMESNVPAYCAPTSEAKLVGSLSKHTRYTVLGFYGDYYIINLRQAAAFVRMNTEHYDTHFERLFYNSMARSGVTTVKTAMRTGPGENYAKIEDVPAGYAFDAYAYIGGWYVVRYTTKSDSFYAFLRAWDVQFK